ncbi:MAG: hypothetical protein P4N60_00255 [Verrucomicrobiae bacterium]|nr:hypothetical protein [Verrucomicrobiae bacterium]
MRNLLWIIAAASLLCGCMSVSTGKNFDESRINQIQKGETTEAQLVEMFGKPNQRTTSTITGAMLGWVYSKGNAGFAGATSSNKTLTVFLDQAGIVKDYSFTTGAFDSNVK